MQEPIDSSGELMKDRRYGTGLREQADGRHRPINSLGHCAACTDDKCCWDCKLQSKPAFGSGPYWKAECIKERERRGDIWKVVGRLDAVSKGFGTSGMDSPEETAAIVKGWLEEALNGTETANDN